MLRTKLLGCGVFLAAVALAAAQPAPQTARQALIEMFFSKTPGTLEKHLPEALQIALKKAKAGSAASTLDTFALIATQLQAKGQEFETFEAGPILLSVENPHESSKFEIVVERDDLQADEDEIEVSFRGYKNGEPQLSGMSPRFTFGMKQETGVWKLNEITFAFKVSLSDPELLKAMTSWQPAAGNASLYSDVSTQASPHNFYEVSTVIAMRNIAQAEVKYAAAYGHGYTCSLSDLGGIGGDEPTDHHAMLIDPGLASGKKHGYRFALTGCSGSSASKFILTAVPADGSVGKAFCTDDSAVVRSFPDENGTSCLSAGKPMP